MNTNITVTASEPAISFAWLGKIRDHALSGLGAVTRPLLYPIRHDHELYILTLPMLGADAVIRAKNTPVGPLAVLAITIPGKKTQTFKFKAHKPDATPASLRLDALDYLVNRAGAPWYRVFIDCPELRHDLRQLRSSLPSFDQVPAAHAATDAKAKEALSPRTVVVHKATTHGTDHIVIATDASIAVNGPEGAGIAWAASDGTTHTRYMAHTRDINWAELNAIHDALLATAKHGHVDLLSDSKTAIAVATGKSVGAHRRERALAERIAELTRGRNVNIQWVRSHNGHTLNETADSLAVRVRHTMQRHDHLRGKKRELDLAS